jgi:hypothetical protein
MGLKEAPRAQEMCSQTGKERFSRGRAKKTAKQAARRSGERIEAYECLSCGGWHVGQRRTFSTKGAR